MVHNVTAEMPKGHRDFSSVVYGSQTGRLHQTSLPRLLNRLNNDDCVLCQAPGRVDFLGIRRRERLLLSRKLVVSVAEVTVNISRIRNYTCVKVQAVRVSG